MRALRAQLGPGSRPPWARLGPGLGAGGRRNALAGDVEHIIPAFLVLSTYSRLHDLFLAGLGGVAAHELRDLGPVRGESS